MGESSPIPRNLPAYILIKKLLWKKRKPWLAWGKKILGVVRDGWKVRVEDIPRGGRLKAFSRR
jgi:nitrogen fixation protein